MFTTNGFLSYNGWAAILFFVVFTLSVSGKKDMNKVKPVVHFTEVTRNEVGLRAIVVAVDHPNPYPGQDVKNDGNVSITSTVLAVESNGDFETENTLYKRQVVK